MTRQPDLGHIIRNVGDKRVLCGKKTDEVGVTAAKAVQAHIDGHDPRWCEDCLPLWHAGPPAAEQT